jgi:hypothetical protein
VPGDVTDDDGEPVVVQQGAFEPVAADRIGLSCRQVPRRSFGAFDVRQRAQQPLIEVGDQLVFGCVGLGAFHDLGDEVADRLERRVEPRSELR